jgi:hypothetical protein
MAGTPTVTWLMNKGCPTHPIMGRFSRKGEIL